MKLLTVKRIFSFRKNVDRRISDDDPIENISIVLVLEQRFCISEMLLFSTELSSTNLNLCRMSTEGREIEEAS